MFGYIQATGEIKNQINEMGVSMDYVVSSVGSGGTLAGFLAGQKIFNLNTEMRGINVCDDAPFFVEKISTLITEFKNRYPEYKTSINISKNDINIIDGYVGEGYAISYKEEIEMIKILAKMEGIILDPVYTGKAFYGMVNEIKNGNFKKDSNILFVHTGGIYGIFPQKQHFKFGK